MNRHRAQKDILYISISSFVIVAVWIASNLYHAYVTSTITPDLQSQIEPIDSKFNTDTIQHIKNRKVITPVFEAKSSSTEADLTEQSVTPSPVGTSSATANPVVLIQKPGP
jgi:hypothetical protein